MTQKRQIEIYSAGCPVCLEAIARIRNAACESCEIIVRDMSDENAASRANALGITSIPAVLIDGRLAACCEGGGPDLEVLVAAGLGRPLI